MDAVTLKKLHECELEILNEIQRVCEKYDIKFFLIGGTLLGSVRHGGFIPWDDDIDIAMLRRDYDRFLKIAGKELDGHFFLQTSCNDKTYPKGFAKVRKKGTAFVQKVIEGVETSHEIYVDIFPYDFVRKNGGELVRTKTKLINLIDLYLSDKRYQRSFQRKKENFLRLIPQRILVWLQNTAARGKGHYIINFFTAYDPLNEIFDESVFLPFSKVFFEGKQYDAPNNTAAYLGRVYGNDYMELPPIESRKTHNPVRLSFDTNMGDESLKEDDIE